MPWGTEEPDTTWLATLSETGRQAAYFAEEIIYGTKYDTEIKMKVRWNQTILELLEHEKISEIWSTISSEGATGPGAKEEEVLQQDGQPDEVDMSLDALSEALQQKGYDELDNKEKLTKNIDADQLVTFQHRAVSTVNSMLVTVDGSKSVPELYEAFKSLPLAKVKGQSNGSFLVWYDVQSSGEQLKDGRRSMTPFRKEHMEKVVFALIAARGEEADVTDWNDKDVASKLPEPDRCDVHLGLSI